MLQDVAKGIVHRKETLENMEVTMLKISLKPGQYINIGDDIRVVFAGGTGNNIRLLVDAPREIPIARSKAERNPERRKDTYYAEPGISEEAQNQIKRILWNEKMKNHSTDKE